MSIAIPLIFAVATVATQGPAPKQGPAHPVTEGGQYVRVMSDPATRAFADLGIVVEEGGQWTLTMSTPADVSEAAHGVLNEGGNS